MDTADAIEMLIGRTIASIKRVPQTTDDQSAVKMEFTDGAAVIFDACHSDVYTGNSRDEYPVYLNLYFQKEKP